MVADLGRASVSLVSLKPALPQIKRFVTRRFIQGSRQNPLEPLQHCGIVRYLGNPFL